MNRERLSQLAGSLHEPLSEALASAHEAGIRFTLVTGKETDVGRVVGAIKAAGPQYIRSIEGYNEPESRHGCAPKEKCWVQPTRDHQARLFAAIKGDAATR